MTSLDHTTPDGQPMVEYQGDLYPADQIGPDGKPLPLSDEVGSLIRQIIEEDLEADPERERAFREAGKRAADERGAA